MDKSGRRMFSPVDTQAIETCTDWMGSEKQQPDGKCAAKQVFALQLEQPCVEVQSRPHIVAYIYLLYK